MQNIDLTDTIQERRQRLEELRKRREQRRLYDYISPITCCRKESNVSSGDQVDVVIEQILNSVSGSSQANQAGALNANNNGATEEESGNSFGEVKICIVIYI